MRISLLERVAVALSAVLILATPLAAQDSVQTDREAGALRVFLDCRSRFCDFDHFRREIPFVNYVRDRQDAQVHVLVTTRRTGAGGTEFTLAFMGRGQFDVLGDSLLYFSSDTDTFDEVRAGLTQMLKLGLVRYVARLPAGQALEISYAADVEETILPEEDPWDYWIFRIRLGGAVRGEQRQSFFSGSLYLAANRTTEEWKIRLFAEGWYSEDRFELSDGSEVASFARILGSGIFLANSLDDHWSVGGVAETRTTTFRNLDFSLEIGPAVEYSYFPYAESTHRALTFLYSVQLRAFDYESTTIFDKDSEVRPAQLAEVAYSVDQPWGSIHARLEGFNYLDDFSQHRVDLNGRLNIQLIRGFELSLHGSVARTKEQIFLARGQATDEEVLLRRRELGTDYRYFTSISLSYTFGSIFNNVVNPRFD